MPNHINEVLLVGAGIMARDYAKVLAAQNVKFSVVGRGVDSASAFEEQTGVAVLAGGLKGYLQNRLVLPGLAIVAVGVEQLATTTMMLLERGVKRILVEKPAGIDSAEITQVAEACKRHGAEVFVGYNRRFYASTLKAKEIVAEDDGVTSFNFEFTEWGHVIEPLAVDASVKQHWFLANSTHVVDLAFFLGGEPSELVSYTSGGLSWHPTASAFAGAGRTSEGALFSYQANWAAPGRWGVEILTRRHRLVFRPMEQLHVQEIGSVAVSRLEIDDRLDQEFKPGLFRQVESFLSCPVSVDLLDINSHLAMTKRIYAKIANPS